MEALTGFFTAPLAYDFMQRALLVALLTGSVCAFLSCYLVLKGWSLMGDAVSHAVLPGIVGAYALGLPLSLGAFAAGLSCAFATGYLKNNSRVKEDAVMAIVFSGLFALGLVMFVKIETDQHLTHVLFGNMLGVTWRDVVETALIALPTVAVLTVKRRDLLLWCFDPAHARTIGLPVSLLHAGLLALLALTIVASLKAVGIILVVAMLIAPGAIAFLLARRFETMLVVALCSAVFSCVFGTLLSFHIDAASGPTIVVTQAGLFVLALIWRALGKRQGRTDPLRHNGSQA
jgi:manganese/iron transport system permease protein